MAVKLRLSRHGTTNAPFYWLVAADSRFARDGRYLETLGTYNPLLTKEHPERFKLNKERIGYWLSVGATPSERTLKLLALIGIDGIDKFTNKNKSTIGKPRATKNPDKRGGEKNASESATSNSDDKKTEEQVQTPEEATAPVAEAEQKTENKSSSNKITEQKTQTPNETSVPAEEKQNETKNSDPTQPE